MIKDDLSKSEMAMLDQYTNFREICMGKIVPGVLFRSGHPVSYGDEDKTIISMARKAGISCIVNLADSGNYIEQITEHCPWYRGMIKKGNVIALGMNIQILGKDFNSKLHKGLEFMLSHKGPYLIHCLAGVDRTGFVSAVLEALMGASIKEIADDYVLSFTYGAVSVLNSSGKAETLLHQLRAMNNGQTITDDTIQQAAEMYLREKVGLTQEQIAELKGRLGGCGDGE